MELSKRLRAARGYAGLSRPALAMELGVSQATLGRWESGKLPDTLKMDTVLERAAAACDLPLAFFTVDLGRLPELVADGESRSVDDRLAHIERMLEDIATYRLIQAATADEGSPGSHGSQAERSGRPAQGG